VGFHVRPQPRAGQRARHRSEVVLDRIAVNHQGRCLQIMDQTHAGSLYATPSQKAKSRMRAALTLIDGQENIMADNPLQAEPTTPWIVPG